MSQRLLLSWTRALLTCGLVFALGACGDADEDTDSATSTNSATSTSGGGTTSTNTSGGTASNTSGGATSTNNAAACVGPTPDATLDAPGRFDGDTPECPTCDGAPAPPWALEDVQPLSCGAGQVYGMEAFRGKPTLVALLSATCPYCHSQSEYLEQLRLELGLEGVDAHFVIVNLTTTADAKQAFVDRVSFPIFQDVEGVGAWAMMGGAKDDLYVYDADLTLRTVLSPRGEVDMTMSREAGYANVKQALLDAAQPR